MSLTVRHRVVKGHSVVLTWAMRPLAHRDSFRAYAPVTLSSPYFIQSPAVLHGLLATVAIPDPKVDQSRSQEPDRPCTVVAYATNAMFASSIRNICTGPVC